ncbi:M28 family peptidase [Thermoleophilia bacterium SCSIO 60948]|nr:M28 family peptidase [Thermoleophilia bacterium SCSIO 60948]
MAGEENLRVVEELSAIPNRGAGTNGERRASNRLAELLRRSGRDTEVEATYVHANWPAAVALHCVLACVASVLAITQPVPAFALILLTATSLYLDLNARFYLLRTLFFRRGSQNVVSRGSRPSVAERIVLCAGVDAPRTGPVNGPTATRVLARVSGLTALPFTPTRIVFWSTAFLVPVLAARAAGLDAEGIALLQVIPTLLLLAGAFGFAATARSRISPGANRNASAVAAALDAVRRLDAEPPAALDVWVVLSGGSEALGEGMRSFARSHRDELDPRRTIYVCFDSVGRGELRWVRAEGGAVSFPADRSVLDLCELIAEAHRSAAGDGIDAHPVVRGESGDAQALRARRLRALTLTAAVEGERRAAEIATRADVPEAVEARAVEQAATFAVELVRALDRDAARERRGAPEAGAGTTGAPVAATR